MATVRRRAKSERARNARGSTSWSEADTMKSFACDACRNEVYFENTVCLQCGRAVGFDPQAMAMVTLSPGANGTFTRVGRDARALKYCQNASRDVCNWLVRSADRIGLCVACELNRTIPNLVEPGSLEAWRQLELAKKRLVYSLLRFGLPLNTVGGSGRRLLFDFMRKATTGHKDGVVTINITEADPVERERQRLHLDEPYRTLLGHLRHECGHFYWLVLVDDGHHIEEFRSVFGDERSDYAQALERHYREGPADNWQSSYVSAYASAHPWEDWAETWAQYLHIVDTVDTAAAVGMEPRVTGMTFGPV